MRAEADKMVAAHLCSYAGYNDQMMISLGLTFELLYIKQNVAR